MKPIFLSSILNTVGTKMTFRFLTSYNVLPLGRQTLRNRHSVAESIRKEPDMPSARSWGAKSPSSSFSPTSCERFGAPNSSRNTWLFLVYKADIKRLTRIPGHSMSELLPTPTDLAHWSRKPDAILRLCLSSFYNRYPAPRQRECFRLFQVFNHQPSVI